MNWDCMFENYKRVNWFFFLLQQKIIFLGQSEIPAWVDKGLKFIDWTEKVDATTRQQNNSRDKLINNPGESQTRQELHAKLLWLFRNQVAS